MRYSISNTAGMESYQGPYLIDGHVEKNEDVLKMFKMVSLQMNLLMK